MASIISVDNIRATGTSTNAMTIDSSNNLGDITMNAEGGTGTLSVRQGSAKAWFNFDGSASSLSARDSLNTSSLSDNATGNYSNNFSNNMNNANYSYSFGSGTHSDGRFFHQTTVDVNESGTGNAPTTSAFRMQNMANGGATSESLDHDHDYISGQIHGDLA